MKKILLTLSAVALVALFACSKTDTPENATKGNAIQFSGSFSETKASLPGADTGNYQFEWAANDKVSIWYTLNGGTSFTTRGEYNITTAGASSTFEYASGNELAWDASGNPHTFVAVYPGSYAPANPDGSNGLGGYSIIAASTSAMTQAAANTPNHITGVRALMAAKTDPITPPADQNITQAVSLDFMPAWAYFEFRMTGTDPGDGRKVTSVQIDAPVPITPAPNDPRYNGWSNSFPSYWNVTKVVLAFTAPVDISDTAQKGWVCIQPNAGGAYKFTISYTSGASVVVDKTVPALAAGKLQPILLNVTPPALVIPHYTLTVPTGQSVEAAIAAAKTAGDIADNYEIQNIVYAPAAFAGTDLATLNSLMNSGSVVSITFPNLLSMGNSINNGANKVQRISFGALTAIGAYTYNNIATLKYIDFGTAYNVSTLATSYVVVSGGVETIKLGHSGVAPSLNNSFFSGWTPEQLAACDLYLGADEMASGSVVGNVWTKPDADNPTIDRSKTFKSISLYE